MYLLVILLLLFLIFGYPLLKLYLTVRSARRRFNDMFGAQQGAYSAPGGQQSRPRRRTKIITRDVGEYVEFEDLPGSPDKSYSSSTSTYVEISQVEDAEWEDITPRR